MKKWLLFSFVLLALISQGQSPAGKYKISYYASNIVKISFQPDGYTHNENITDAVVLKPMLKPTVAFAKESSTGVAVSTTKGVVAITATGTDGKYGFDVQLKENEKIYGGGERALPLNRRGYRFDLYNNPWYGYSEGADNLNFSVPFFTSSEGYGLFFDNGSRGFADIGKTNPSVFETGFVSGEINVFVITGKTYAAILTSYQQLTGRQPLPPRWAMGNFMSRFGYSSQQQAQEIAAKMKSAAIPFNAIIFDLFWFGDSIKGTLGNLDWVNKTKWPDPKKMITGFKKNDINTILITEPFILKGTRTFNAAQKYMAVDSNHHPYMLTDFYFGYGGIIDVFRKDAQNWIWNTHYKKQIANGVAGWWTDLGEPEKHP
ncbi:MAG: glycosyl hydrolase, partial [Bacteroidetes bacterium]|nr:glycosyl hydrolase [Bacteroidota bacterium]